MSKGTLTQLFFTAVERHAALPAAFRSKVAGAWTPIAHRAAADRVQAISLGLRELGVQPGDRVALVSENRPEWALADYACLCARAADVPIYPTLTPKQTEYILRDSEAVAVLCSTANQLAKVLEVRAALPALRHVIVFDAAAKRDAVLTLAEVEAKGRAAAAKTPDWKRDALAVRPDDLATLIYTSGTTGDPKGVMLSHHNIWSNVQAVLQMIPIGHGDECLSMLPLSHSYERMVDYTLFQAGVVINYAESFDTVAANLQEVKPTVVLSVPRLYEKVYARVLENALSGSAVKRAIFFWAKRAGEEWATHALAGLPIPGGLAFKKRIADGLVFSKLRARTGGRIRFFVSGAAPLSADIAKFFYSAGLPVIEGYGLTESSPVLTLNPLERIKLGTVGKAIPGVELKIAADGEIFARGPNIMRGYYKLPDATRETVDAEGWLHTGDIGEIDSDGYLKITDRKKELIKTAGGKYIAPQPIEGMIKRNKFVANAVLYGDRRKFPIVLVVPNYDSLERWAKERSLSYASHAELIGLADVKAKVEREVMGSLRDLAKFEMPKKVILLERDFTIEAGELTPTLKVKRRVVEKRYKELIDRAYASEDAIAAAIEG
ncbi:MAG TPA: long-chain fatty acid--CoA ligase [Gemmatimonadales bacterium]|jgi:long-chain acyl-CoA synthetase|nr:long-chain fatty acid--CoA ligase [Gemmatimonadales bacterium]